MFPSAGYRRRVELTGTVHAESILVPSPYTKRITRKKADTPPQVQIDRFWLWYQRESGHLPESPNK
jgi:hypothetical protein